MSNISPKIDSIIKVRNSRIPSVDRAIENLEGCIAAVRKLETMQANCINGTFNADSEIIERIKAISFTNFYTSSNAYKEKLNKLKERFSRKNLHISLVGRARMGKSLVIQRITGLDGSVIPSSDGSDCTGTKSIITNSDRPEVCAEITFYSEYELVAIINTYLENILYNKSMNISSVSQIATLPINEIKLDYSKVKESQYLAHLKKYVDNISSFVGNLGKTITVTKEHIEEYVAQYSHSDFNTKYYNFLGVKCANILTSFPYSDAGKIVLLDTIGIGTTSLGVEGNMLDIVENDSDAIVFMFRPDSLGPRVSQDEIEVIDKISKRVGPEYAKEMLFWVINKVIEGKGKNIDYIQGVIEQINSSSFPVSEILQVNCNDKDEVEQKLLLPILEKISSKIEEVDKLIVENARIEGQKVYSEYSTISAAVDTIFYNCTSKNIDRSWGEKFRNTRDELLKNNLRDLYLKKYDKLRKEPCKKFKDACDIIMKKMFDYIPSEEKVIGILNKGNDQHRTLLICFDRLRLDIIDAFLSLDNNLSELIFSMKNEVLDIFRNQDKGRLELLVSTDESCADPNNWMEAFLEKTDAINEYSIIAGAFTKFINFECTVQGFLIYEIRDRLDKIDESLQHQLPKMRAGLTEKERLADEIINILSDAVSDIHNELRGVLDKLAKVPNQAMFAAIKDLYDRTFLENRDSITNEDASIQWEYLYQNWKHIIWKDEFEKEMSVQNRAREINSIVDDIKKRNKQTFFEIVLN